MDHSIGLLFIDGAAHPNNGDFSFHVAPNGDARKGHGWGRRGATCPDIGANPPPSPNFHTIYVEAYGPDVQTTLRDAVEEHKRRYNECRVWVYPRPGELAQWVDQGMPMVDAVLEEEGVGVGQDAWATEEEEPEGEEGARERELEGEVEQEAPAA